MIETAAQEGRAHREPRRAITLLEQLSRIPERSQEEVIGLPQPVPDRLARGVEPGADDFFVFLGRVWGFCRSTAPTPRTEIPLSIRATRASSSISSISSATRFRYASGERRSQHGRRLRRSAGRCCRPPRLQRARASHEVRKPRIASAPVTQLLLDSLSEKDLQQGLIWYIPLVGQHLEVLDESLGILDPQESVVVVRSKGHAGAGYPIENSRRFAEIFRRVAEDSRRLPRTLGELPSPFGGLPTTLGAS
jgi:hypothetical protein